MKTIKSVSQAFCYTTAAAGLCYKLLLQVSYTAFVVLIGLVALNGGQFISVFTTQFAYCCFCKKMN